jgi:hypothetical protein
VPAPASPGGARQRSPWFTNRALLSHAILAVWVPGCAVATWWQVGIALSGDQLGWIYSVMWPCFALFAIVFWWHFVHDDPDTVGRRGLRRIEQEAAVHGDTDTDDRDVDEREIALARAEAEDPELAAYNAYLAALARETRPSSRRGR